MSTAVSSFFPLAPLYYQKFHTNTHTGTILNTALLSKGIVNNRLDHLVVHPEKNVLEIVIKINTFHHLVLHNDIRFLMMIYVCMTFLLH